MRENKSKTDMTQDQLEIKFNLKIHFVSETAVDMRNILPEKTHTRTLSPVKSTPFSNFTSKELMKIRKLEPKVLKWLKSSKENALNYSMNPVETLAREGFLKDRTLLKKIQRIRDRNLFYKTLYPNIHIKTITVDAKPIKGKIPPKSKTTISDKAKPEGKGEN